MSPQYIDTWGDFITAFDGLPVRPGDDMSTRVTYNIINDNGIKKLQVNVFVLWGSGLVITDGIQFKAGDIIEFKGKLINGPSNGMYVNRNCWGYDPLQNWNQSYSDGQIFEKTFVLTADDAATINANAINCNGSAISFKTGGIDPWNGEDPAGVGKFAIEQIKISRIE
jgi:hypothetical protein